MEKSIQIIISGGGTGGHIFPALAIANVCKQHLPNSEILFVGAEGRMEMQKVPEAGYLIKGLPIAGLQRSLDSKNILLPIKILKSVMMALKIISEFKPTLAIGVGGYASAPLLFAAKLKGIPFLIQEQNSYAGITNKILSKWASKICVAYEGMDKFFPKQNIVLTGNPVRKMISESKITQKEGISFFGLDEQKKTLLVIGGSLGARTINESINSGISELSGSDIQLIWQTGKSYFEVAKQNGNKSIRIFDFIKEMDYAYAAADLVVSRAGALSVSELCIVGKPCILIPSPNVAEDHQTKNAMALVNKNAAMLVKDEDAKEKLVNTILEFFENKSIGRLENANNLATAIKSLAIADADERIYNEIEKIIFNKK